MLRLKLSSVPQTGSLEGQHYKATRQLVSLSEQLVDCCPHASDGGGNVDTAFDYIHICGGIEPEEKYPYKGKVNVRKTGSQCHEIS